MVNWFTKKQKSGRVSHFTDEKKKRDISTDDTDVSILPEDLEEISSLLERKGDVDKVMQSDDSKIEQIKDLTAEQREKVEDYVGSQIVLVYDNHITKPSFIFENQEEWIVYKSREQAKSEAVKKIKENLRNYQEMFDQDWLDQFRKITMLPTDRREKSEEEAKNKTEYASREELEDLAYSNDVPIEKNWDDEKLRSQVQKELKRQIYDQLEDPMEYFVETNRIYTKQELVQQPWIKTIIDYESAAEDAVEMDGISHFLSTVDDNEVRIGDLYLYRLR